jgi:ATP-dependent exoDNAse (exonuclease V) alpha subunit
MSEDYEYLNPHYDQDLLLHLVAKDVSRNLANFGKTWGQYQGLPVIPEGPQEMGANSLINEQLSFDRNLMQTSVEAVATFNVEQRDSFDSIMASVNDQTGLSFFVDGPGGTGKTYMFESIAASVRMQNKIVLTVASSGIASNLLLGSRTAHSRFNIPLTINAESRCNIGYRSENAELIRQTSLIIWDEAPMMHKHNFEALDRTLRDIMQQDRLFGGKCIVFCGDFRQVLPVVPRGSRPSIVNATLKRSYIWRHLKQLHLTQNMRLNVDDAEFSEYLLRVGEGREQVLNGSEFEIDLPENLRCSGDSISDLVDDTYPSLETEYTSVDYLMDRVILACTNSAVDDINTFVSDKIQTAGDFEEYLSTDTVADEDNGIMYPVEFLNSLSINGMASHSIKLKVGLPVMLLRNLNPAKGLCNGTRLIVRRLMRNLIEAEIAFGKYKGTYVFIPRITMSPINHMLPFTLLRRQFPLRLCFAMTINKSQGQTLKHVGVCLTSQPFSHGQLYVAMSRVTSSANLKILSPGTSMTNVVYREIYRA